MKGYNEEAETVTLETEERSYAKKYILAVQSIGLVEGLVEGNEE